MSPIPTIAPGITGPCASGPLQGRLSSSAAGWLSGSVHLEGLERAKESENGPKKWWVQRGSKPNKQRRWDFTWVHPSKMIIQQGNSEMSINENGTCWFHQNWMYWASGLQMRGTSASCLQKNAWCIVRMTDQWVLWPIHGNLCIIVTKCSNRIWPVMAREEGGKYGWGPPWCSCRNMQAVLEPCRFLRQYFRFTNGYVTSETSIHCLLKMARKLGRISHVQTTHHFAPKCPKNSAQIQPLLQPMSFPIRSPHLRAPAAVPRALLRDLTFPWL